MVKRLIYISGTRADFGLFRSSLETVSNNADFEVSVCLTGTHLDSAYGNTVGEIEASRLGVAARIPVPTDGSEQSVIAGLSIQVREFGEIFRKDNPHAVIVLGDRGEMLMAAVAAIHENIPILHIHGGELSGTIDESMRHAISKLSHYHFVATESSAERLRRMGEQPDNVFVIGAPGLDDIPAQSLVPRSVWSEFGFNPEHRLGLVIFHPVVQDATDMARKFEAVIEAAFELLDAFLLFRPNSDIGRIEINESIDRIGENPRVRVVSHLDRKRYLDILSRSDLVIGNSSSGIIEAASFSVPVVNVGDRQNLRECSENVFQADSDVQSIISAGKAAYEWRNSLKGPCCNIYGDGKAGARFLEILRNLDFGPDVLKKVFYE